MKRTHLHDCRGVAGLHNHNASLVATSIDNSELRGDMNDNHGVKSDVVMPAN
jgi:hypothetical protein